MESIDNNDSLAMNINNLARGNRGWELLNTAIHATAGRVGKDLSC